MKYFVLAVFSFLVGGSVAISWLSNLPATPVGAVAFVVCGSLEAVIVTKSDGDSTMYKGGSPELIAVIDKIPLKYRGTLAASGAVCPNAQPRVF